MMADESLIDKIHDLSDLELALLLCLVSQEHCLISTPLEALSDLTEELQLVADKTFGLSCAVIDCDANTTLDSFTSALLLPKTQSDSRTPSPYNTRADSYFVSRPISQSYHSNKIAYNATSSSSHVANVVLAKNLDRAPHAVQIQALELLRTKRIYTRTSVHTAPKQFLFIPVSKAESGGQAKVTKHLNDHLFVSHWHDPEDGYVNMEEASGEPDIETASTGSVVKKASPGDGPTREPLFSEEKISRVASLSTEVDIEVEVRRYMMNIVSFLRLHRAVEGGISPTATKHLEQLTRCLAPLHDLDFVTPGLVDLAVRKVYLHRIQITSPQNERSMQWGSKFAAVTAILEDVAPEDVIEDVLEMVTAPL